MNTVVTHHRHFHNDEVMAIALLELFYFKEDYKLIRTRDKDIINKHQKLDNSFVIDVGFTYNESKLNFDHHQNDTRLTWEDGTPYSSCGLVWKFLLNNGYLNNLSKQKINFLTELVIKNIDKQDNGVGHWSDGVFISMFNRNHHDNNIMDKQFKRALLASKDYLNNIIHSDGIKKHNFSFQDALFISILNFYLGHIEYNIVFNGDKVGINFTESDNIKHLDLFKEAVNTFSVNNLWTYLEKTNVLNGFMNKEVASKMKAELVDKAISNNVNIVFLSLYQYNIKNSFETQFKKSLKSVQQFFLNTFSSVKNEIKNKKEVIKFIKKSSEYKGFVLCSSNIKEAPTIIAEETNDLIVVLPRTNNSWKIQAVPENANDSFSQRFTMPESWCGLSDTQLKKVSGNNRLIFCHKKGFMCMFEGNKEQVIDFVNTLLRK